MSSPPDPVELLQQLIRFDTTNPPGNEAACIQYINNLLSQAGCTTTIVARDAARPNLISRISGNGTASPLLLYGHVDVVTTEHQNWSTPPFEGRIHNGEVWGRGALDMKGGVAMIVTAFLRCAASGVAPSGDVILAVLSDEEAGGEFGAKFLVEHHPDLFKNVRFAIGEFGGFSFHVAGKKFYPIQVAEKQWCRVRATVRGPGGHGSLPMRDGAMAAMGSMLWRLNQQRLPVHVTPLATTIISSIADHIGFPNGVVLRRLLSPSLTDRVLDMLGERGQIFDPILHNTVNATIVKGGEKVNVVPSHIQVDFDGRLLPGCTPTDLVAELHKIIGRDIELEVLEHDPGPAEPDMGLFDMLASILRKADPDGIPIPLLLPGVTDARFFSRLGIQTYGFLPMPLPANLNFTRLIHAADERVPVEAIRFGTAAVEAAVRR